MMSLWNLFFYVYVCLSILLFLIAAFGRRLGLRKIYIDSLLKLFQFSQQRVAKKRRPRVPSVSLDESDSIEDIQKISFSHPKYLGVCRNDDAGFHFEDILEYISAGVSAIVEDAVLTNFFPEEPPCWNLLTRTNTRAYEFVSFRLTFLWVFGFLIRYLFLLFTRLLVLFVGMLILLVCTVVVGAIPSGTLKRKLNARLTIFCFDFVAGSLSLFATFHNPENRPKSGITVANHTSPIDSMILSTDNVYDMVGQRHGGLLGYFMTLLSRSSTHIWFERSNSKDRSEVARRMKEHTADTDLPPILIFPEGVCVNNTSVVQFKKGAFEIGCEIYPVAIRFDPRFGDAYWHQDSFFLYCVYMMTSWAIVCDVWYLPPVTRGPGENAIAFANRVKATIARKGGMTDVSIDGFLKVKPPRADLKLDYQREFAKHCSTPKRGQSLRRGQLDQANHVRRRRYSDSELVHDHKHEDLELDTSNGEVEILSDGFGTLLAVNALQSIRPQEHERLEQNADLENGASRGFVLHSSGDENNQGELYETLQLLNVEQNGSEICDRLRVDADSSYQRIDTATLNNLESACREVTKTSLKHDLPEVRWRKGGALEYDSVINSEMLADTCIDNLNTGDGEGLSNEVCQSTVSSSACSTASRAPLLKPFSEDRLKRDKPTSSVAAGTPSLKNLCVEALKASDR